MKVCPHCHTEYDDTRKFCRQDGSPLELKKAEVGLPVASNLLCVQCGKPIETGKKFCRHCGTPITPKAPSKIEVLEKQLAKEPAQISVMIDLAQEYLGVGKAQRAIELLEKAVAQKREDIHLHLLLGQGYEAAKDHEKALSTYLAALARDSWNPEVEAALFREELLLKTYPRSVDELTKVAIRRGSAQLWRLLAQVSETKGDLDKMVFFLTEAIQVKPDDMASLEALARLSEKRQQETEAAKWHQRVLQINPSARESNLFFARQYYAQGKLKSGHIYKAASRLSLA